MKTLKLLIITIFLLQTSAFVNGQNYKNMMHEKKERIKAQKVAFITEKLELTSSTAQLFWPIYNEYEKKREAIYIEKKDLMMNLNQNLNNMSDKEIEDAADMFIDYDIKLANLNKEYNNKFKTALTPIQIIKLIRAEHQFKQHLIKQIRGKGQPPRGQGGMRN
ncbi:MAG: hypothetical protein KAT68_00085 [Bacteroidales bacterium]|nr:hypothetical protein [Bacteroidales bacterium]